MGFGYFAIGAGGLRAGLIALALAMLPTQAFAAPRQAALVIDAHTGQTLYSHEADVLVYPASLTKLMTVYMLFEAMAERRLSWSTRIPISDHAASQPPSRIGLDAGDSIDVRAAVQALIVKSANDIASAVAEFLGGSEARFAQMMTRRARQLGLRQTVFRNASGLPDREQVTTARDMAWLALRIADEFPQHFHLFSQRRFTFRGRSYRSHNGLLGRYPGANGMKTGYIRASGFNLVASVRRNRRHVIGVVFGGRSARTRNATMRRLITAFLPRASTRRSILRQEPQLVARPPAVAPPRRIAVVGAAPRPRPVASPRLRLRMARVRTVDVRFGRRIAGDQRESVQPGRRAAPLPAPAAPTIAAPTQPGSPAGGGRPPSTLNAQAARLARFAAAPAPPAIAPARRSALGASPAAGRYQVQVGAYGSASEAMNRLSAIRSQLGSMLGGAQPITIPVPGKPLFRARFAGFDSSSATEACLELRRQSIDCFVARE